MSKNIVVCTDGTWDHPDSKTPNVGTTPDETNVFKFFALLPGEAQSARPACSSNRSKDKPPFTTTASGPMVFGRYESPKGRPEPV